MLNRSAERGQKSPIPRLREKSCLFPLLAVDILQMPFIELRVWFSIPGC